ncbi:MAG: HEAT repeat domain-containing protein, partial [Elusimicrobia bacterium]|nr:HEAT repeat domain-containing protein [Elusimicrobiota bacterium]
MRKRETAWLVFCLSCFLFSLGCASGRSRVPSLIKALKHKDPQVRVDAAKALGELGPSAEPAIPALLETLKDNKSAVFLAAAKALVQVGTKSVEALALTMREENAWFRCRAAEVLGMFGPLGGKAVPTLIKALEDHDLCVHDNAAESLGKIGKDAVPALLDALKITRPDVRKGAAKAIAGMDEPLRKAALASLLEVFKSEDEYARGEATMALVEIGEPAVSAVLACLKEENPRLRERAIALLGEIVPKSRESVLPLLAAFKDPARIVRLKAAVVLGRMGDWNPEILPVLLPYLRSGDLAVRRGVIEAIGNMGPAGE